MHQREHPLLNLFFNIVLPIIILNKGYLLWDSEVGVFASGPFISGSFMVYMIWFKTGKKTLLPLLVY